MPKVDINDYPTLRSMPLFQNMLNCNRIERGTTGTNLAHISWALDSTLGRANTKTYTQVSPGHTYPQFCAALEEADSYFSNRGFEMRMSREDKVEVAQFIIDRFYENCERDGPPLSRPSRRQKPLPQSAFEPRPISLPPFSRQEELDKAEAAYEEALANKQYDRLADLARSRDKLAEEKEEERERAIHFAVQRQLESIDVDALVEGIKGRIRKIDKLRSQIQTEEKELDLNRRALKELSRKIADIENSEIREQKMAKIAEAFPDLEESDVI